jgi:hypothetical protein
MAGWHTSLVVRCSRVVLCCCVSSSSSTLAPGQVASHPVVYRCFDFYIAAARAAGSLRGPVGGVARAAGVPPCAGAARRGRWSKGPAKGAATERSITGETIGAGSTPGALAWHCGS